MTSTATATSTPTAPELEACTIYGVADIHSSDTVYYKLIPDQSGSYSFTQIGPMYHKLDGEGLGIHPQTGDLYVAIRGNDVPGQKAFLAKLDKQTGELYAERPITLNGQGVAEVTGVAFTPTGELWVSAADPKMLAVVDVETGVATRVLKLPFKIEGLAWLDGTLYATDEHGKLFGVDLERKEVILMSELGIGEVEGLATWDGLLWMGHHSSGRILAFDPASQSFIDDKSFSVDGLTDIESLDRWGNCGSVS